MDLKVMGFKFNLATVVVALLIGFIICCFTLCSCTSLELKEGFNLIGAPTNYKMGDGVPGDTWPLHNNQSQEDDNMYASLENNVAGKVPLPDNELFLFYDNKFSPECCYKPQQYSSSTGCACLSPAQMKYLSSRGGNNTLP